MANTHSKPYFTLSQDETEDSSVVGSGANTLLVGSGANTPRAGSPNLNTTIALSDDGHDWDVARTRRTGQQSYGAEMELDSRATGSQPAGPQPATPQHPNQRPVGPAEAALYETLKAGGIELLAALKRSIEEVVNEQSSSALKKTRLNQPTFTKPSANPQPFRARTEEERLAKHQAQGVAAFPPRDIYSPPRRQLCAVKFSTPGSEVRTPLIGSPYGPPLDYVFKVSFDAGRYAQACIKLHLRVAKEPGGKNIASLGGTAVRYYEATFKVGVQIDQGYHIKNLTSLDAKYVKVESQAWDDLLSQGVPPEKATRKNNMAVFTFESDGCKLSDLNPTHLAGLPENVKQAIAFLFFNSKGLRVFIYVPALPSFRAAHNNWIRYLEHYVSIQKEQLYPYLNDKGRVRYDLSLEPIHEVCNGMLVSYPPQKRGNRLILNEFGWPLEDETKRVKIYSYAQVLNWDESRAFGIYSGVPVIRDYQFVEAQSIHIGRFAHYVYFQRFPRLGVKVGEAGKEYKDLFNAVKVWVRFNHQVGADLRNTRPAPGTAVKVFLRKPYNFLPHRDDQDGCFGTVIEGGPGLLATGTDFCIHLTIPRAQQHNRPYSQDGLIWLPTQKLIQIHIVVLINPKPVVRALEATANFADPDFEPESLGPIKNAFMQDPSPLPDDNVDLTKRDAAA